VRLVQTFCEIRVYQAAGFDKVDGSAEEALEGLEQFEVVVKSHLGDGIVKLEKEIDIAGLGKCMLIAVRMGGYRWWS
jgi:hypothetical protein